MKLTPAQQAALAPQIAISSSGPSIFTIAIIAGVAYGGYRLYKHFRKE